MFCKKAKSTAKQLIEEFDAFEQAHIGTALQVTKQLDKYLAGPLGALVVGLIPGTVDDVIRTQLLRILPEAIDVLTIENACKNQTTLQGKATCFVTQLRKVDPQLQQTILNKLAAVIARELDNNKLADEVYELFVQLQKQINAKAA